MVADGGGIREDKDKPRTDLIPPDALLELAKVYSFGYKKYHTEDGRNWERGMSWSRVIGPLTRHLYKWMAGYPVDDETGISHMTHVVWNALALLTYEIRNIGTDDRNKTWQKSQPKNAVTSVLLNCQTQNREKSSPIPMPPDTWENTSIPLR